MFRGGPCCASAERRVLSAEASVVLSKSNYQGPVRGSLASSKGSTGKVCFWKEIAIENRGKWEEMPALSLQ